VDIIEARSEAANIRGEVSGRLKVGAGSPTSWRAA
jgi:hypothetical protein